MARIASQSERLKKLMEVKGLKQTDLARDSGIDKSSISHYVAGHWEAKQDSIYKIANAYGVNEAWLMGFEVPMDKEKTVDRIQVSPPTAKQQQLIDLALTLSDDQIDRILQIVSLVSGQ